MNTASKNHSDQSANDFWDVSCLEKNPDMEELYFLPDEDVGLYITLDESGKEIIENVPRYQNEDDNIKIVISDYVPLMETSSKTPQEPQLAQALETEMAIPNILFQCEESFDSYYAGKEGDSSSANITETDFDLKEHLNANPKEALNEQIVAKSAAAPKLDDSNYLLNDLDLEYILKSLKDTELFNEY